MKLFVKPLPAAAAMLLARNHERVSMLEAAALRALGSLELEGLWRRAHPSSHAQQPNASTSTAIAAEPIVAGTTVNATIRRS